MNDYVNMDRTDVPPVPEWGAALIEHVEKQGELLEDIVKYQGMLEERVARLEDIIGRHTDKVAALELYVPTIDVLIEWMRDETKERLQEHITEPTPWEDLD